MRDCTSTCPDGAVGLSPAPGPRPSQGGNVKPPYSLGYPWLVLLDAEEPLRGARRCTVMLMAGPGLLVSQKEVPGTRCPEVEVIFLDL